MKLTEAWDWVCWQPAWLNPKVVRNGSVVKQLKSIQGSCKCELGDLQIALESLEAQAQTCIHRDPFSNESIHHLKSMNFQQPSPTCPKTNGKPYPGSPDVEHIVA